MLTRKDAGCTLALHPVKSRPLKSDCQPSDAKISVAPIIRLNKKNRFARSRDFTDASTIGDWEGACFDAIAYTRLGVTRRHSRRQLSWNVGATLDRRLFVPLLLACSNQGPAFANRTRPLPFRFGSEIVSATRQQIEAGQAVYTHRTLRAYDLIVLGVSNRLIWKCPTAHLLDHYNEHVSDNHLEVGVGTGYFLDRCRFRSAAPRVALLDLNSNALDFASSRIGRYQPEVYRRDVLSPLSLGCEKFDSVAVNYVLHCLPGTMQAKSAIFDHLAELMNRGASIFGSTLLQGGVDRGRLAKRLMRLYNRKGIFCNDQDSLEDLEAALRSRFTDVQTRVIGCAALFSARLG